MSGQACAMCPPVLSTLRVPPQSALTCPLGITESLGDPQVKSSLAGKQASYLPILIQVLPPQCPVHFWFDRLFSLFRDSKFFHHDHYLLFFLPGEGTPSHTWVPALTLTKHAS